MSLTFEGVHAPSCPDLETHIGHALREIQDDPHLDTFVDRVRDAWHREQQIADAGDDAVIRYWQAAERDFYETFGMAL
ncbi:MAG: hypothetical protein IT345_10530 [Trueperaceae bacterium]|nr:hypothetical protein [Trueperaceae bacterium]